jgi:hypothetical protein
MSQAVPDIAADDAIEARCLACGTRRIGPYCHACGQASVEAPRRFSEVFTGQTGRLLHTLRLLFTRPGELAREIDEGRDRRSMRPLTLLLNLIPLFFLLGGGAGGFGASTFAVADKTGEFAGVIASAAQRRNVPLPVFQERLEQRFRALYSLLVVVQVASYGAMLGLVERRKRKPWLVHFAAAIHYMCFSVIVSTVLFGGYRLAGGTLMDHPIVASIAMVINAVYLFLSIRRIYGDGARAAGAKTLLVMAVNYLVAIALTTVAIGGAIATA